MTELKEKKILLFCARFFGYQDEIKNTLEKWGASVDLYDQRPSNTFFAKALIRINNNLLKRRIAEYYKGIFEKTKSVAYDYVVFVSPETITPTLLQQLRNQQRHANFTLYMWDALQNKNDTIKSLLPLFDRRLSFDRNDCDVPSNKLLYRPLFFLNAYASVQRRKDFKYDLLFIGTIHSDRYKILNAAAGFCQKKNLKHFYYMFFPSRVLYYAKRGTDKYFMGAKRKEFQFAPLKQAEVLELVQESNVVIDIQHPHQTGLTMRTIEILGAKRKLITTNKDIVNYDFYHPANIYVLDRDSLSFDYSFFKAEMVPVDEKIYNRYSIDGWIRDIFGI